MKNKYSVVSLFSGSGGLDLGFLKTERFEVILANDNNHDACASYEYNIGDHIRCCGIQELTSLPTADVVIGGPPCQGFSLANPQRSFEDPRNWLFREYARVIESCRPAVFLMENVSGMVKMSEGMVLELILKELQSVGYEVQYKLLNAKDYEVPQHRVRVIIVGIRNDINVGFRYPEPVSYGPLFGTAPTVGSTLLSKPIKVGDPNHKIASLSELNQRRIRHIPPGGSMKDCPPELWNNSDLRRAMRRLHPDNISPTIVHNNNDHYYHPFEDRRITIREMARLQTYPEDYIFKGSKSEQSRQVGNSVPVNLAFHLGNSVASFMDEVFVEAYPVGSEECS